MNQGSAAQVKPQRPMETLGWIAVLAALYFVSGKLGLLLAVPPGYATIVWPPSGLSVGALLIFGRRLWPGIFVGSLVLNASLSGAFSLHGDVPADKLLVAAAIAGGSTLQALLAHYLVARVLSLPVNLRRVGDAVILFLLTGPLACLTAASVGTAALYLSGAAAPEEVLSNWRTWWAGDVVGVVIFLPLMLVAPVGRQPFKWRGGDVGRLPLVSLLLLLVPLGMTFYAWKATSQYIYDKSLAQFTGLADENQAALLHRLDSYEQALLGGLGFFSGSDSVTRHEWRAYTDALGLAQHFPGINGIGYISDVPADQVASHEARMRLSLPSFRIHPETAGRPHFIIDQIEPVEANKEAVGLNIGFEDNRVEAATRSRDTGRPAITERILLVQDQTKSAGFLLLHPMYRRDMPIGTVAERRQALTGWIYAPFVGRSFMHALTPSQGRLLNLRVYDGDTEDFRNLIYASDAEDLTLDDVDSAPNLADGVFTVRVRSEVMQQRWTIVRTSTPAFEQAATSHEPSLILAGGLLGTALVGALLFFFAQRAETVNRLVEAKTREISANEERLRLLIRNTPAAVAMFDKNLRHIMTSERWIEDFKLEGREIVGRSIYAAFPGAADTPFWVDVHRRALAGEIFPAHETAWTGGDGEQEWVKWAIHPWIDSGGEIGGIVVFSEVITARKRAEAELRASEDRFRSAMEYASTGMALVELDGRWLKANPALCALLGYTEEELRSMDFRAVTHPDDLATSMRCHKALLSGEKQACRLDERYITKSGRTVWVDTNVSIAYAADGTPKYFICHVQDITEQREMERIKSEFISVVSHELRTPLTSIRGSLGLLAGTIGKDLPGQAKQLVDIALKNSERLILLINDILDLDKIATGNMRFDMKVEPLAEIVRQAVEVNRAYGDRFGVTFKLDCATEDLKVKVDAGRLSQVLANLLSNAAKFSPENSEVHVRVERRGNRARVSVRDFGPGVPESFRSRIFTRFSQADSSVTREKGGTGLGLHISKQLIERMNGIIGFETAEGAGSTFWIELAETREDAPTADAAQQPREEERLAS